MSGDACKVAAFVEKPNYETAQGYLVSGDYLWNAGIFVFRADVMLDAFASHMPELVKPLDAIRAAWGTKKAAAVLAREFKKMPATSIDYGVAERAPNIAVVPASCGWSDVGSFNALPEVRPTDAAGNVAQGEAMLIDSSGCVVLAGTAAGGRGGHDRRGGGRHRRRPAGAAQGQEPGRAQGRGGPQGPEAPRPSRLTEINLTARIACMVCAGEPRPHASAW